MMDAQLNFRGSNAGAYEDIDDVGQTYVLDADGYSTVRNSLTFGWESGPEGGVDRDSGVDPRFAGINFRANNATPASTFRLDLPAAGTYDIRVALGDTGFTQDYQYCELQDDSTTFATIDDTDGTAENEYTDASGVTRTEAAWPGDNVKVTHTFTSTILRVKIGLVTGTAGDDATTIAHLSVIGPASSALPAAQRQTPRGALRTGNSGAI